MVLDKISNLKKYIGVVPFAEEILAFLSDNDAAHLSTGRYDVADDVFVNVCDCVNSQNEIYEAHRKYSDLQCVITGDEIIKRCHIDACADGNEYSEENDCILYKTADQETVCHLYAGEFALFEPEDGHCPGICGSAPNVRKLIFKIPVLRKDRKI